MDSSEWVAFDVLPIAVIVADETGAARYANRAWVDLTDQRDDRWLDDGWLDALAPSDREAMRRSLLDAAAAGSVYESDWTIADTSSGERILHVNAVPASTDQSAVMVATFADMTSERAEIVDLRYEATHDSLTKLFNRAQFLEFARHALDQQIRHPNRQTAVLFIDIDRLKRTNDLLGHAAGDRVLQLVADRISTAVRPADIVARYGGDEFTVLCQDLLSGQEAEMIAERIRLAVAADPDEQRVSVSIGVAVVEDPSVGAARVINEADQSMYGAKGGAGSNRTRSLSAVESTPTEQAFAGVDPLIVAAHELRNPLTVLAGAVDLLRQYREQLSDDELNATFDALKRQTERVVSMVEELLDFGRTKVVPTAPVRVADVVAEALEAAPPPDHVSVSLHCDLPASRVSVRADRNGLTRVVTNLLTNAYRYGGPHVTIETRLADAKNLTVSVLDDGAGVPDSLLPALFAPFTRGRHREPAKQDGLGLGLAIARRTTESTGGHLDHEPVHPHGARFTITLPRAQNLRPSHPSSGGPTSLRD